MTDYIYVTHTLPTARSAQRHLLAHRPALSPLDLNYKTRSQVFTARRDRRPVTAPMVCRWQRGR